MNTLLSYKFYSAIGEDKMFNVEHPNAMSSAFSKGPNFDYVRFSTACITRNSCCVAFVVCNEENGSTLNFSEAEIWIKMEEECSTRGVVNIDGDSDWIYGYIDIHEKLVRTADLLKLDHFRVKTTKHGPEIPDLIQFSLVGYDKHGVEVLNVSKKFVMAWDKSRRAYVSKML